MSAAPAVELTVEAAGLDTNNHERDPRLAPAGDLVEFPEAADRLPGIRADQRRQ